MKRRHSQFLFCAMIAVGIALHSGCARRPLSLWNEGAQAKTALVHYVKTVTKASSPDYIPPKERVAVFDLDGTLFLETAPTYFDWLLFEHRVLDDPSYHATDEQLAAARASRAGRFPKLDAERERMVSEAYRIHVAHLFAPYLAVHTSAIDPLPHQISAVYQEMLPQRPDTSASRHMC